jgi:hypothetical protein
MDRHALELSLRAASSRVVLGQQALLSQRRQIGELERYGLDAATAKALLRIYEQSQVMNLFDRDRLRHELDCRAEGGVCPTQETRDSCEYDDIDFHPFERQAA